MSKSMTRNAVALLALGSVAAGCVSGPAPANYQAARYAPQHYATAGDRQPQGEWIETAPAHPGAATCHAQSPQELSQYRRAALTEFASVDAPLAPGDRLSIKVLGDSDRLSGTYVVGNDGTVRLRGMPPPPAQAADQLKPSSRRCARVSSARAWFARCAMR